MNSATSRQRRRARDREAHLAAEARHDLLEDQALGQEQRDLLAPRHALAGLQLALGGEADREQHLDRLGPAGDLRAHRLVDAVPDPRHREHQVGLHLGQVAEQLLGVVADRDRAADGDLRAELDAAAEDVRPRQERQAAVAFFLGRDRQQRADVRRQVVVAQAHPLGVTGRARGVDDRRDVVVARLRRGHRLRRAAP
jgi:hypothetical protein